ALLHVTNDEATSLRFRLRRHQRQCNSDTFTGDDAIDAARTFVEFSTLPQLVLDQTKKHLVWLPVHSCLPAQGLSPPAQLLPHGRTPNRNQRIDKPLSVLCD